MTEAQLRENFFASVFNWITSKITNAFTSFKNLFTPLPENPTTKDKIMGSILLVLEVVKSLKIKTISDYAQKILKVQDTLDACLSLKNIPTEFDEIIQMFSESKETNNEISEEDKIMALSIQKNILDLFDYDFLNINYGGLKYYFSAKSDSRHCALVQTALENPSDFLNRLFKKDKKEEKLNIKQDNFYFIKLKFYKELSSQSYKRVSETKAFDNNSLDNWCIKGNFPYEEFSFSKFKNMFELRNYGIRFDNSIFCIQDYILTYKKYILEFNKYCKEIQKEIFKNYENLNNSFRCDQENRFNSDDSIERFIELYKLLGPVKFKNSKEELRKASEKYIPSNNENDYGTDTSIGDNSLRYQFDLLSSISEKLIYLRNPSKSNTIILDYLQVKIKALQMSFDCSVFNDKNPSWLDKLFTFFKFIKKVFSLTGSIIRGISRCVKPVVNSAQDQYQKLKDSSNKNPTGYISKFKNFLTEKVQKYSNEFASMSKRLNFQNIGNFDDFSSLMADRLEDYYDITDKLKADVEAVKNKSKQQEEQQQVNTEKNENEKDILDINEKPESKIKAEEEENNKKNEIIKSTNKKTLITKLKEFIKFEQCADDCAQLNTLGKGYESYISEAEAFMDYMGGDAFSNSGSFLTAEKQEVMQGQVNEVGKNLLNKMYTNFEKTKDFVLTAVSEENFSLNMGKYFANDFDGFHDDYIIEKAMKDEKIMEKVNERFKKRMENELEDFKKKPFDYSLKVNYIINNIYVYFI